MSITANDPFLVPEALLLPDFLRVLINSVRPNAGVSTRFSFPPFLWGELGAMLEKQFVEQSPWSRLEAKVQLGFRQLDLAKFDLTIDCHISIREAIANMYIVGGKFAYMLPMRDSFLAFTSTDISDTWKPYRQYIAVDFPYRTRWIMESILLTDFISLDEFEPLVPMELRERLDRLFYAFIDARIHRVFFRETYEYCPDRIGPYCVSEGSRVILIRHKAS